MRLIVLTITLALLSGCVTTIPQSENFPKETQKKMMAAKHWNYLAKDAVARTLYTLEKEGFALDTPLYIGKNTNTVFDNAFRKYMIANLINAGAVVSTRKYGALEVKYDTQVIKHAGAFEPSKLGYKPGMATAGVAGLWVLHDIFKGLSVTNGLTALGAAGAYDAYKAKQPGETGIELLLTTSITHDNRYVMLNADAYYIEKAESWLFEPCKGRNRKYCR